MRTVAVALVALACAGAVTQSQATVIHDTLGPDNGFDPGRGWSVGGGDGDGNANNINYVTMDRFTAAAGGTLTSATAGLWIYGPTVAAQFELRADNAGLPGEILDFAVTTPFTGPGLHTVNFSGNVHIDAGTTYWFGMSALDPSNTFAWALNVHGIEGFHAFTGAFWQAPGEWMGFDSVSGAARIEVSAVPEPETYAMLLAGLGALGAFARRRKTA